jgi:hypothetical protein
MRKRLDKLPMDRSSYEESSSVVSKREVNPAAPILERRLGSARVSNALPASCGITKAPNSTGYLDFQGGTHIGDTPALPDPPGSLYMAFKGGALESYPSGGTKKDFILWRAGQINSSDSAEIVLGLRNVDGVHSIFLDVRTWDAASGGATDSVSLSYNLPSYDPDELLVFGFTLSTAGDVNLNQVVNNDSGGIVKTSRANGALGQAPYWDVSNSDPGTANIWKESLLGVDPRYDRSTNYGVEPGGVLPTVEALMTGEWRTDGQPSEDNIWKILVGRDLAGQWTTADYNRVAWYFDTPAQVIEPVIYEGTTLVASPEGMMAFPAPRRASRSSTASGLYFDGVTAFAETEPSSALDLFFDTPDYIQASEDWTIAIELSQPDHLKSNMFQVRNSVGALGSATIAEVSGGGPKIEAVMYGETSEDTWKLVATVGDITVDLEATDKSYAGISETSTLLLSRNSAERKIYFELWKKDTATVVVSGSTAFSSAFGEGRPLIDITDPPRLYLGAQRSSSGELEQYFDGCIRKVAAFPFAQPALGSDQTLSSGPQESNFYFDLTTQEAPGVITSNGRTPFQLRTEHGSIRGQNASPPFFSRGVTPDGEALALTSGVVVTSGGMELPDGTELTGQLKTNPSKECSSVRAGDKVFISSGDSGYVVDETDRTYRPIGLPRPTATPGVQVLSGGSVGETSYSAVSHAYRFISKDGTASSSRVLSPSLVPPIGTEGGSQFLIGSSSDTLAGEGVSFPEGVSGNAMAFVPFYKSTNGTTAIQELFEANDDKYLMTEVLSSLSTTVTDNDMRELFLDRGYQHQTYSSSEPQLNCYNNRRLRTKDETYLHADNIGGMAIGLQIPSLSLVPEESQQQWKDETIGLGYRDFWYAGSMGSPALSTEQTTAEDTLVILGAIGRAGSQQCIKTTGTGHYSTNTAHRDSSDLIMAIYQDSSNDIHPALIAPQDTNDYNGHWYSSADNDIRAYSASPKKYDVQKFSDIDLTPDKDYLIVAVREDDTKMNLWVYDREAELAGNEPWTKSSSTMTSTGKYGAGFDRTYARYMILGGSTREVEPHKVACTNLGGSDQDYSWRALETDKRVYGMKVLERDDAQWTDDRVKLLKYRYFDSNVMDEDWVGRRTQNELQAYTDEKNEWVTRCSRNAPGYLADNVDAGRTAYDKAGWVNTNRGDYARPATGAYRVYFHTDRDIPISSLGGCSTSQDSFGSEATEMGYSPIGDLSLYFTYKPTGWDTGTSAYRDTFAREERIFTYLRIPANLVTNQDYISFLDEDSPWQNFNPWEPHWFQMSFETHDSGVSFGDGSTSNTKNDLDLIPEAAYLDGKWVGFWAGSPDSTNIIGWGLGSRITDSLDPEGATHSAPASSSAEVGRRGSKIYDARFWKKDTYWAASDFNLYLDRDVPVEKRTDLLFYYKFTTDDKGTPASGDYTFGTVPTMSFANLGTYATSGFTWDKLCLTLADVSHSVVQASPLSLSPSREVVAIEFMRSLAYGIADEDNTTEVNEAKASSQGGPFFVVGAIPIGAKKYTDNAPQSSLSNYVDQDSGFTPNRISGIFTWQGFLGVWGDAEEPSSIFFAEPGPFGWESFPESMRYRLPATEAGSITAAISLGESALIFSKGFAVVLRGDPSAPTTVTMGGGVGAHSSKAVATYSGVAFAYNGTLWAVDESGKSSDIGAPVRDLLPSAANARLAISSALASLYVIDDSSGSALRFYFPTQTWSVENRDIVGLGDYNGETYFIHTGGQVSKSSATVYEDNFPGSTALGGGTVASATTTQVTITGGNLSATSFYPGYDENSDAYYQDYKGMLVISYNSSGGITTGTADWNSATAINLTGTFSNSAPAAGEEVYLGIPEGGFGLDTGSVSFGSLGGGDAVQSIIRGVGISASSGAEIDILHAAASKPDDPRDASTVGDKIALAANPNQKVGLATRGRWHRINLRSLAPKSTKVRLLDVDVNSSGEQESVG